MNIEHFSRQQTYAELSIICPIGVFCPPPQEVKHGYLVAVQKSEYNVGDSIYYLCKKTYQLDGPNQVTCQLDGTWSTVTSCRGKGGSIKYNTHIVYSHNHLSY